MSSDMQDLNVKVERTRRNIIRMGAIGASTIVASLGTINPSTAGGPPPPPPPPPPHGPPPPPPGPHGPPGGGMCLLRGTTIWTASGSRNVEDLAIGDLLPTMFGGLRPIQWIGHYPIKKSDPSKPWAKDARPVRIARSALAPNVPQADLYVTQAHGVFIDDVLVSAEYLVNETTITLCETNELNELEFFHIKLESHDVIYAEGAPVESLLNVDESAINFADYFRMHGMPTGDETPCVPFLSNWRRGGLRSRLSSAMSWNDKRRRIAAIRNRLKQRAVALSQELEPAI